MGILGNQIRDRAGSEFSKDLFENFWLHKGDMILSASRFSAIVKASKGLPGKNYDIVFPNGELGTRRVVNFYGSSEYALALGSATLIYNNKGQAVGFYDYYDFDWKSWGSRSIGNEIKTRMVDIAGMGTAEPYSISYGYGTFLY